MEISRMSSNIEGGISVTLTKIDFSRLGLLSTILCVTCKYILVIYLALLTYCSAVVTLLTIIFVTVGNWILHCQVMSSDRSVACLS